MTLDISASNSVSSLKLGGGVKSTGGRGNERWFDSVRWDDVARPRRRIRWMMYRTHATPTGEAVRKRLAHLIHEITNVPLEQITDIATVDGDIRMESVAFVELQVAIEDEYQIEI